MDDLGFFNTSPYDVHKVARSQPGWPGKTCLGANRTVLWDERRQHRGRCQPLRQ